MDYRRENGFSNGNVVQILTGSCGNGGGNDNWGLGSSDQAIWATEDDYGMWNGEASADSNSNSNMRVEGDWEDVLQDHCAANSELACAHTSPTVILHTALRNLGNHPLTGKRQEIVAAHEEDLAVSSELREEFQIPIVGVTDETQRSFKGRHCKKFYTEEGCPYGENCTFLHDEQSKSQESVAISLGPGSGGGYGNNANGATILKPSNWKTSICNKWELTGYCPFGSKCHFAHGCAELHHFGGLDSEAIDSSTPNAKQGLVSTKTSVDSIVASLASVPHSDGYHLGVPAQRLSNVVQKIGQRPTQKWKGPDKISKIYGYWINDL